jgi:hypothetical protein
MTATATRAALLVIAMLAPALVMPLWVPADVLADPVKPAEVHIQTFLDGVEAVEGVVERNERLDAKFTVPAGGQVFCATLEVARLRHNTTAFPLSFTPRAVWCGELDDEKPENDIAIAYPLEGRVDILTLKGTPPALVLRSTFSVPDATAVVMDDLDSDRDKDLLVTSGSGSRLYIFEAVGVDSYALPRVVPVGPRPTAIATQDLDRDFRRDIIVANSGGSSLTLLFGRGDLGFYPKTIELGKGPCAIDVRDVNRDLFVDVVVAESRNSTVKVMFNVGNGNFTGNWSLATGEGPVDVEVADMNGDSLIDIAAACSGTNETWVYQQLESGQFELWEVLPSGKSPRAVTAVHFNRAQDLNRDILTVNSGSDNVSAFLTSSGFGHEVAHGIDLEGRPMGIGTLIGGTGREDAFVVIGQMPPTLSVVRSVGMANGIHVGFGEGGTEDTIDLPSGTEVATITFPEALNRYIDRHKGSGFGGMLTVLVEVWADQGGSLRLSSLDVWVRANRPPRADAGLDLVIDVGEVAKLNASASYDQDGDPLEYIWLLPDVQEPVTGTDLLNHVFEEMGTYVVLLVVKDRWGLADQDDVQVTVNSPPVAQGTVPAIVTAREVVRLSAHLSEDVDGYIVDYIWDYSQGVVHGRTVDVMFTGSGTWNVTLEVIDDADSRSSRTFQMEVLPSTVPLRPPAEQIPEDKGEVPAPGAIPTIAAMAIAVIATLAARRRPFQP